MTGITRSGGVQADQWELTQLMVKCHLFPPACLTVTTVTAFAQRLLVRVILLVTVETGGFITLLLGFTPVAVTTAQLFVLAIQGVVGLFFVVILYVAPLFKAVTIITFFSVAPFMFIIILMAIVASGFFKFFVFEGGFFPLTAIVAILTLFTQLPFVTILLFVAADTTGFQLFFEIIFVTTDAAALLVLAGE